MRECTSILKTPSSPNPFAPGRGRFMSPPSFPQRTRPQEGGDKTTTPEETHDPPAPLRGHQGRAARHGDVLRQWGQRGRDRRLAVVERRGPQQAQRHHRPAHPRGPAARARPRRAVRHPGGELPPGDPGALGAGLGRPLRHPPGADHGAGQRLRADRARTRVGRATPRSARRWAACGRSPATPTCRRSGSGISIGDSLTGMFGALGALAALEARRRTGRGQVVDASIFESVLAVTESLVVEWCARGHGARAHRPDAARDRPEQRLPHQRRPAADRGQPGLGVPPAGGA